MDRITVVVRDKGKVKKADFDGQGNCISGDANAVKQALALVAGITPPEIPVEPAAEPTPIVEPAVVVHHTALDQPGE
jgi:hypothetical protein